MLLLSDPIKFPYDVQLSFCPTHFLKTWKSSEIFGRHFPQCLQTVSSLPFWRERGRENSGRTGASVGKWREGRAEISPMSLAYACTVHPPFSLTPKFDISRKLSKIWVKVVLNFKTIFKKEYLFRYFLTLSTTFNNGRSFKTIITRKDQKAQRNHNLFTNWTLSHEMTQRFQWWW